MNRTSRARRVTAQDVADALGISAMTVSRALNGRPNVDQATRRRVIDAARRLGYTPNHIAKSLVTRKTQIIGVVVPEITHSFFPEAIRGIEEVAHHHGYQLILTHSAEDAERERDAIRTLDSSRVDGILISTAGSVVDFRLYRKLIRRSLPIVFFDRCVQGIGASCVSIDDEESARRITGHLVGHGYRKIAHLSGSRRVSIGLARLQGYRKALRDGGIEYREELVVESGFQERGGYDAMSRVLDVRKDLRPRAVVAINDPAAYGAMCAALERGFRVPEDIALVGFSDDIRSELMPTPLTTVRQPAYELGKKAGEQLCLEIEKKLRGGRTIIVPAELIIRRSCGCHPPATAWAGAGRRGPGPGQLNRRGGTEDPAA